MGQRHEVGQQPATLDERHARVLQHLGPELPRLPPPRRRLACVRNSGRYAPSWNHRRYSSGDGLPSKPPRPAPSTAPRTAPGPAPATAMPAARPARGHVPRPGTAVTLHPGPPRPREEERPLLRKQLPQALVPRRGHAQGVHVVRLAMVAAPALQRVPRRPRQRRLPERGERRRLVHVVPEPGEPPRQPLLVEPAPPLTHARVREIREHRVPRPHHPAHHPARRVPHERVLGRTPVEHRVAGHGRHRRIDDRHQPHTVPPQLLGQLRQLREPLLVHREHPVLGVVVDVQVHGVQRQPALLVARDDPADLLLAAEPPPGVMVTERPRGRQRRRPVSAAQASSTRAGVPTITQHRSGPRPSAAHSSPAGRGPTRRPPRPPAASPCRPTSCRGTPGACRRRRPPSAPAS